MLLLTDSNWQKAHARAIAAGLTEEEDGPRFEEYVRSAYESERKRSHILFKAKAQEPKPHVVKKRPSEGAPVKGGWASGQRPDQKAEVHGRIVGVGKHGVMLKDDKGKLHKIRHEHLTEHAKPIDEKEWPKASQALLQMGLKVDPISRFKKAPKKERPDAKSKKKLKRLGKKHKDLDHKRALKEGTPQDVQTINDYYGAKKPLKKSLKLDPDCEALGGSADARREIPRFDQAAIICPSGHSHPLAPGQQHVDRVHDALRCGHPTARYWSSLRNHAVVAHGMAMVRKRNNSDVTELTEPPRTTPAQQATIDKWTNGQGISRQMVYADE